MRHPEASRPDGAAVGGGGAARADWLSYRRALEVMLENCPRLPSETVRTEDALGRALAGDVIASVDHPPWDNSAMDGYAVRAEDVAGASADSPAVLPISADVPAGDFPAGPLRPGTVARVMTGAPVPDGASGVVRVEHTDGAAAGRVAIFDDSDGRRNIRFRGEDLRRGERVLRGGDTVSPAAVGILVMLGIRDVEVGRRPRVGILANGDELADFDEVEEVFAGRKIMNSNSYALAAQLRAAGAEAVLLGIARDDRDSVREKLTAAKSCDAVVSTAGVSVGAHDHVRAAFDAMGLKHVFWRARIRPGSPLAFGLWEGRPVWGLPGNPVSAMVTAEVFLRPAVRHMRGHRELERPRLTARARKGIRSSPDLTHFYRVRLEPVPGDLPLAELTGPQGSGMLTSMAAADGLAVIGEGVAEVEAGERIEVIPLRWGAR